MTTRKPSVFLHITETEADLLLLIRREHRVLRGVLERVDRQLLAALNAHAPSIDLEAMLDHVCEAEHGEPVAPRVALALQLWLRFAADADAAGKWVVDQMIGALAGPWYGELIATFERDPGQDTWR